MWYKNISKTLQCVDLCFGENSVCLVRKRGKISAIVSMEGKTFKLEVFCNSRTVNWKKLEVWLRGESLIYCTTTTVGIF